MRLEPGHGRFLHIVPDDKFIDAARGVFEDAAPGAHDYARIGGSAALCYLRTFEPVGIDIRAALGPDFLRMLDRYSAVFVHFLTDEARLVVDAAPATARFVWLGWGADFYHLIHRRDELLLPETRAWLRDALARTRRPHDAWNWLGKRWRLAMRPGIVATQLRARRTLRRIGREAPDEMALVNRFSAIATPIPEDFEAMRSRQPGLHVPFLDWNYWTEGFDAHACPASPTGEDILLGNSATPENNHLDALEQLSGCLGGERRIIGPLSYGDRRYGDIVEKRGRELFGDRFVALREYMDSTEYSRTITRCSVVVMNHLRQQALGNIVIALCSGARVFMQARNPISTAMRRIGVGVEDIASLPQRLAGHLAAPDRAELGFIRERIDAQYGRPSILRRTRHMLDGFR
jgi:hypothetical protein